MSAAHFKLDNLTVIVDRNRQQLDGFTKDIMKVAPLDEKWLSFGWHCVDVDGHNCKEIIAAFDQAQSVSQHPTAIIAHTLKGKGVSFMEDNLAFHGKAPTPEQLQTALEELA